VLIFKVATVTSRQLKPMCRYSVLSLVHISNDVEATLSNATSQTILFETNGTCSICFEFVEKIGHGRLIALDSVASTLLLVWMGL